MTGAAPTPTHNSVCMYVEDATGRRYCFTVADNRPDVIAQFRKHAAWWRGYAQSHEGRQAMRNEVAFPVRVVVETYYCEPPVTTRRRRAA